MNIINKKYDKVICICLKERNDKYEFIKSQFNKYNINVEFYRPVIQGFNNILFKNNLCHFNQDKPNELGAFLSHYYVIKTALLEGVNNLFVFEDDCLFHNEFNDLIDKYIEKIPNDADGILLYSFQDVLYPQNIRVNSRWTKAYKSWSLICYGMNKRAMEKYIEIADKQPQIADLITYKMMESGFNFYVASPPLVIPSKHESNVRNIKNYETIRSIYLLGVDDKKYI